MQCASCLHQVPKPAPGLCKHLVQISEIMHQLFSAPGVWLRPVASSLLGNVALQRAADASSRETSRASLPESGCFLSTTVGWRASRRASRRAPSPPVRFDCFLQALEFSFLLTSPFRFACCLWIIPSCWCACVRASAELLSFYHDFFCVPPNHTSSDFMDACHRF